MIHSGSRDELELDLGIHARDGQFFAFKLKICVCFCLFGSILLCKGKFGEEWMEWSGEYGIRDETRRHYAEIERWLNENWRWDESRDFNGLGIVGNSCVPPYFLSISHVLKFEFNSFPILSSCFPASSSTVLSYSWREVISVLDPSRRLITYSFHSFVPEPLVKEVWICRETGAVADAKPSSAVPVSRYLSPWQIVCTLCFLLILL